MSALFAAGCSKNEPLRIGYVGTLTGRHADLGTAGRDGAIFAVEDINRRGGIKGRPVELVIRDDRDDPETAKGAVRKLAREGVAAIVGPMTSTMAVAAVPVVNDSHVVMVGPTITSNDLSGKDDNFLRVYPTSHATARHLAHHARRRGIGKIAVLYDLSNRAHTEGWYRHFREEFEREGGRVVAALPFDSSRPVGFLALARQALAARPDGVFLLSGGLDAAMLCQQLRKLGVALPVIATEWSATDELILHGGSAVEGITYYQYYDRSDGSPRFAEFREAFSRRFGTPPEFGAVYAYDATQVVLQGLAAAASPSKLKEAILARGRFSGIQGEFTIDRFGDADRKPILMTVTEDGFKKME
ncbi:ABC transporter substrate-binding protein [Geobacter pickeringii]|uniref:ABC transporter substrate-binding protein n=1 Tax=Geobacter pickeringii TaxID=345632 RepID=UPI001F183191|nr:ABC transporter substrate-binding protein [Geobacter pickeringii]